jgi:hypothetical protein
VGARCGCRGGGTRRRRRKTLGLGYSDARRAVCEGAGSCGRTAWSLLLGPRALVRRLRPGSARIGPRGDWGPDVRRPARLQDRGAVKRCSPELSMGPSCSRNSRSDTWTPPRASMPMRFRSNQKVCKWALPMKCSATRVRLCSRRLGNTQDRRWCSAAPNLPWRRRPPARAVPPRQAPRSGQGNTELGVAATQNPFLSPCCRYPHRTPCPPARVRTVGISRHTRERERLRSADARDG